MYTQTPQFLRAVERTVRIEGGFVDNPADRGGPTNLGVTLRTLDRWYRSELGRPATLEDLKNLNHEGARQLYCDLYWNDRVLPCQDIAEWWEPMGAECFDSAVLHGPKVSAMFLQRGLNIINLNEKAWPDLETDGWAGPATLEAMRAVDNLTRGKDRLMLAVNVYQGRYITDIAENDPTQEAFVGGWLLHRVQIQGAG